MSDLGTSRAGNLRRRRPRARGYGSLSEAYLRLGAVSDMLIVENGFLAYMGISIACRMGSCRWVQHPNRQHPGL